MSEENLTFETALGELEQIVKELESGKVKLEDAAVSYEKAMKLKNFCEQKLKEAELKIEKICMNEDGSVSLTKFEGDEE